MKAMPQIQKYMTAMPHTIGKDIPISTALTMMREHQFRHLPVQDGGKLIGILSDRDVRLANSFAGGESLTAADVMMPDPYTVDPDASLNDVVFNMAEHKYGCVIVQQKNGKVVGIFTATDALRVLGDQLGAFYKHRAG